MKNVLYLCVVIAAFLAAGCTSEQPVDTSITPPTATLRPFPTATITPSQAASIDQDAQIQPSDPTATPFVHVVQEGDTLLSIALRYGVGLEELVLVNPGIDPQFLSVGTSLRIPGPEGEAVDVLLPTPTPVSISASKVSCFEALTGEFRCLALTRNDLSETVEAISGIIGLYDDEGVLLAQKSTDSLLQILPPGRSVPLSAIFNQMPAEFAYGRVQILSAIRADPDVSRSVPIEARIVDWQIEESGRGARVEALITLPEELQDDSYSLRLLATATGPGSQIVGYRLLEEVIDLDASGSIDMDFYILSLGPSIEAVDVAAELLRLN